MNEMLNARFADHQKVIEGAEPAQKDAGETNPHPQAVREGMSAPIGKVMTACMDQITNAPTDQVTNVPTDQIMSKETEGEGGHPFINNIEVLPAEVSESLRARLSLVPAGAIRPAQGPTRSSRPQLSLVESSPPPPGPPCTLQPVKFMLTLLDPLGEPCEVELTLMTPRALPLAEAGRLVREGLAKGMGQLGYEPMQLLYIPEVGVTEFGLPPIPSPSNGG